MKSEDESVRKLLFFLFVCKKEEDEDCPEVFVEIF